MFSTFEKYLSKRLLLSSEELKLLESRSSQKKIAKRGLLLREGEVCNKIFFVTDGMLRLYRTDPSGAEFTLRFAIENSWLSDRESYLTGNASASNISAIENSEVLCWSKNDFRSILAEVPLFRQFMRDLLEKGQIGNYNRIYSSISTSAEQRFRQFI